ncbi:PadR family transcriptional regulator [Pseudonocardia humida]|uniref:PadR family transcriptional regulator n=1 Tax=Pseudonocardia humida TaxID=2800819 RepID=A0ABT0ZSM0_9PSEU|nr:PadR family transcriptional regulator [Pseudonocardia humida]MCO1653722.1 PadR family transcriptional regulator [Pseudonocardia humida]
MHLRRADRDLPALTVLALLLTGPRHAYEMHRLIVDTHKDFVTGLPRSMYHAVDRLLRDGLIAVHDVRREGPRPERTVYALTDAGRAALADRVRRLLAVPDADATLFVAALSFIGVLSREQALTALLARLEVLAARLRGLEEGLATVPAAVPRLLLVESEFERARLGAEHDWVAAFVAEVRAGSPAWPDEDGAAFAGLVDLLPEGRRMG